MIEQDEGRWLTYAEAGQLLGISPEAVRQLARRRSWPRRTPNAYGDLARVLVPHEAIVRPRPGVNAVQPPYERGMTERQVSGLDRADESGVRAFEAADLIRMFRDTVEGLVGPLREQLERERGRVDRAENRVSELETALADAIAAERIVANAAVALRHQLDLLRARRPWWRRRFR